MDATTSIVEVLAQILVIAEEILKEVKKGKKD